MVGRQRFLTLEAMRGTAAICIVLLHGRAAFGAVAPAGGYLAVDFFFLLSGFIMAHVYADALDRGLGAWAFLRARIIRFYPLYLVGSVSTVVLAATSIVLRHDSSLWGFSQPLVSLPFAMFMLPAPVSDTLFPLDLPAWSLLLELVVNAAFAWGAWRRNAPLIATAAASLLALVAGGMAFGTMDVGWNYQTLAPGIARVFFSFPLGVLLYRVRHRVRVPAAFGVVAPVVLIAMLYAGPDEAGARLAYDMVFITVASPLLLLAAASHEPAQGWLTRVYRFLGVISFPLYILHHSTEMAVVGMMQRHVPPGLPFAAVGVALLAGLVLVAWLAARLDVRVHSMLRRTLPWRAQVQAGVA